MNIQESAKMRGQIEAMLAMIQALAAQLDRAESRLSELESRPRPGRPPKERNEVE